MQLQDLIDKNLLDSSAGIPIYDQKHTVVKIKYVDLKMIRMLTGMENYSAAEEILRKYKCNIVEAANEKVEATLVIVLTMIFPVNLNSFIKKESHF